MKLTRHRLGWLTAAALLTPQFATAEELMFFSADNWSGSIAGYGWLLGMHGDVTIQDVPLEVEIGTKTVLENLEFAVMGTAKLYYQDRIGLFLDSVYGSIGSTGQTQQGPAALQLGVDANVLILTFGASYRFNPIELGPAVLGAGMARVTFEPYAGGRYYDVRNTFDLAVSVDDPSSGPLSDRVTEAGGGASGEQAVLDVRFTDPLIGIRSEWELADRLLVTIAGDIGGFGVGSDFSWDALGHVGYRFGLTGERDGMVFVGYRANGADYSTGSGESRLEWNVMSRGPVVGFSWRF